MAQPSTIYKPGKLNYVWNYLSSTLDNFKAKLLGYRTYKTLITQTGLNAPVGVVLENNLGINLTYEYDANGIYYAYLDKPLFDSISETIGGKKVEVFITPSSFTTISANPFIFSAYPVFFDVIEITTFDINNIAFNDNALGQFCSTVLEIRVYNK